MLALIFVESLEGVGVQETAENIKNGAGDRGRSLMSQSSSVVDQEAWRSRIVAKLFYQVVMYP